MRDYNFVVGDNGRLNDSSRQIMASVISTFAGKHIKIRVWEASETASNKQRKYYFAVIVYKFIQYYKEQGQDYTKRIMHNSLMRAVGGFNKPFVNALTGEEQELRISYNDLSVKQVEGYHLLCIKRAAELGFSIPLPNEDEAKWLVDNYK